MRASSVRPVNDLQRRHAQAELAHLGVLDASHLSAIVGGVNDEQIAACAEHIAACAELTQFAAQLDDHGGSSSGDSTGKDWGHRGASAADGADADAEGDGDGDGDGRKKKVRDRGLAWSEEEHKLFLQGLDKFGKGDWRSISRQCVLTRTPAQVASHAQKYFIRQEGGGKEKPGKRVSIHDISSLEQSMPDRNQRKRRKQDREAAAAAAAASAPADAAGDGSGSGGTRATAAATTAAAAVAPAPAKKKAPQPKKAATASAPAPGGLGMGAAGSFAAGITVAEGALPFQVLMGADGKPAMDGAQIAAAMAAAAAQGKRLQLIPMPLNAAFQLNALAAAAPRPGVGQPLAPVPKATNAGSAVKADATSVDQPAAVSVPAPPAALAASAASAASAAAPSGPTAPAAATGTALQWAPFQPLANVKKET